MPNLLVFSFVVFSLLFSQEGNAVDILSFREKLDLLSKNLELTSHKDIGYIKYKIGVENIYNLFEKNGDLGRSLYKSVKQIIISDYSNYIDSREYNDYPFLDLRENTLYYHYNGQVNEYLKISAIRFSREIVNINNLFRKINMLYPNISFARGRRTFENEISPNSFYLKDLKEVYNTLLNSRYADKLRKLKKIVIREISDRNIRSRVSFYNIKNLSEVTSVEEATHMEVTIGKEGLYFEENYFNKNLFEEMLNFSLNGPTFKVDTTKVRERDLLGIYKSLIQLLDKRRSGILQRYSIDTIRIMPKIIYSDRFLYAERRITLGVDFLTMLKCYNYLYLEEY